MISVSVLINNVHIMTLKFLMNCLNMISLVELPMNEGMMRVVAIMWLTGVVSCEFEVVELLKGVVTEIIADGSSDGGGVAEVVDMGDVSCVVFSGQT